MIKTTSKAQFNVTSAKAFRATIAKYDSARVDIAQEIASRNDRVASLKGMIVTNNDRVAKLDPVKDAHKIADIQAETLKFEDRIATANAELDEYKKAQSARFADALALVTEELYKAYAEFTVDAENAEKREILSETLHHFFADNGVLSGQVTVDALIATMGNKGNGYSGKKGEYATGNCLKAKAIKTFKADFLLNLIHIMRKVNALPTAKYTYVPVKMRNK